MMDRKRIIILSLLAVFLLGLSFSFGAYLGYQKQTNAETIAVMLGTKEENIPEGVDFTLLLQAWNIIDEKYPFDKPDNKTRLWGAISGLIESIGDPYSTFLPPEESKLFTEDISGDFGGVGMEIGIRDGILTVISPLKNTPADKAGLLAGDRIIKINDESTAQMSVDEAVSLIRGPIGTDVKLTIFREDSEDLENGGETFDVVITRAKISIPTLETDIKDDVYIISLFNFNAKSKDKFSQAISAFKSSGFDKLIIDLRNNPGGFLDAAVDISSYFVPQGKVIVKEDFGEKQDEIIYRSKGYNVFRKMPKIVVLVNGGSASASEIFAAALQEHNIATIVGTKTFGKGSVQELVPFADGTFIKITVAKWLTPGGNSISDGGVTPDVIVEMKPEDIKNGVDTQLEEALNILKN